MWTYGARTRGPPPSPATPWWSTGPVTPSWANCTASDLATPAGPPAISGHTPYPTTAQVALIGWRAVGGGLLVISTRFRGSASISLVAHRQQIGRAHV